MNPVKKLISHSAPPVFGDGVSRTAYQAEVERARGEQMFAVQVAPKCTVTVARDTLREGEAIRADDLHQSDVNMLAEKGVVLVASPGRMRSIAMEQRGGGRYKVAPGKSVVVGRFRGLSRIAGESELVAIDEIRSMDRIHQLVGLGYLIDMQASESTAPEPPPAAA